MIDVEDVNWKVYLKGKKRNQGTRMAEKSRLRPGKREAIMAAAVMEMEARGYQGASMDRIALAAKASKRTVYNYFPSKEALFREVVDAVWRQAHGQVQAAYDPAAPLREQLLALASGEAALMTSLGAVRLTRVLLSECIRSPRLAARLHESVRGHEVGLVDWLRRAAAHGRLTLEDPEFAAEQLVSLLKGFLFWPPIIGMREAPTKEKQKRIIAGAVDMFLSRYER